MNLERSFPTQHGMALFLGAVLYYNMGGYVMYFIPIHLVTMFIYLFFKHKDYTRNQSFYLSLKIGFLSFVYAIVIIVLITIFAHFSVKYFVEELLSMIPKFLGAVVYNLPILVIASLFVRLFRMLFPPKIVSALERDKIN